MKNIKIKILIGLVVLIVGTIFFVGTRQRDDGIIKIGYSADTLVIERWKRDMELFKQEADKAGVEVIYNNANENNERQVNQIKALIDANVDVLVIIPYDKNGISAVVKEAIDKGIKVVSYDRLINDAPVDVYLSFDNLKVGELMAEALIKETKGNYVLINGSPEDNNSSMFRKGYVDYLQSYVDSGEVSIIKEVWANDWREAPAYDAIVEVLNEDQTIDAIIGANDHLAEATIRALSERGLAGQVYVAGHDADISACQRIVEGTQHVTIYKPIENIAFKAVEIAIKLAKDEPIDYEETINNGYEVPYLKLDVIPVTKENMRDTVIKDGFHREEDVYRD